MEFEDLWNKYLDEDDMSVLTDETLAVFQQEWPEAEYENEEYDAGELIVDYVGHHEGTRQYDKIQALADALREKHLPLFRKEHVYFSDALINYYCFRRDAEALLPPVQDFIADTADYDLLLMNLKRLVYYNHRELADTIIANKYQEIKQNDNLLGQAEFNLASMKYYMLLEDVADATDETLAASDWEQFRQSTAAYDYDLGDEERETIASGLREEGRAYAAALPGKVPEDEAARGAALMVLQLVFMRAMQAKRTSFPISSAIWGYLLDYWEERESSEWKDYFRLTEKTFKDFLRHQSGVVLDYRFEMALILWGSCYVLDFLHDLGLLDAESYEAQRAAVARIKQGFRRDYRYDLWEYDFVHDWEPPQGIRPEDWQQEREEFAHSIKLDPGDSTIDRNPYFSAPLLWDALPSSPRVPIIPPKPAPTGPKIGRNERVSVRYKDGTLQENVKYKKVADDLDAGACELV